MKNITDPSGGSVLVTSPMTVQEARDRIFDYFSTQYKKTGENVGVEWRTLGNTVGIPQNVAEEAVRSLTTPTGNLYLEPYGQNLEYVRLGSAWLDEVPRRR